MRADAMAAGEGLTTRPWALQRPAARQVCESASTIRVSIETRASAVTGSTQPIHAGVKSFAETKI
jgi:hypothetical protein